MASLSLLHSTASSFHGRSLLLSAPHSVRAPRNVVSAPVRAEANPIVLVDKADCEKVDRLKTTYFEKIVPLLKEEFKYENVHQIPKISKIVVNCGMGEAAQNSKGLDAAINDLAIITGQRPVKTVARNSVAAFKIREGQTLGIAVTLRGDVMYAFLDRLINLGLPRSRDFQGVSPYSFDGHGNYSLGLSDQGVFPDIKFELQGRRQGMDVNISTTANNDKEAYKLLALMGMPFKAGVVEDGVPRKKKLKAHHFSPKKGGKGGRR